MTRRSAALAVLALFLATSARAQRSECDAGARASLASFDTIDGALQDAVVLERHDIERWGWARVSELLEASTWAVTSIDQFSADASADGLPTAALSAGRQPDWLLVIDGQPVPVRVAGARLLELIPVSVSQIERVTFSRTPTVVAGRLATRGIIFIQTRRMRQPVLQGSYVIGNERGDPGPYRYTALATPNVERLGPDAHAGVGISSTHSDAQFGTRYSTLNITDEALLPRITPAAGALGYGFFQRVTGFAGRAGLTVRCGRHDLLAGRSSFRGVLYQPRRDDWTQTTLSHTGVAGDAPIGSHLSARYSVTYTRVEIDSLPPAPWTALPRSQRTLSAHGEMALHAERAAVALSVSGARHHLSRTPTLERDELTAFARATYRHESIATEALGGTTLAGGVAAPQALIRTRVALQPGTSLALGMGHAAHPLLGAAWVEGPIADASSTEEAPPSRGPSVSWVDAMLLVARPGTTLRLGTDARRVQRWRVRSAGEVERSDADVIGVHASMAATLAPRVQLRVDYRLSHARAAEPALAFRSTPRHVGRATLTTTEMAGFRFSGGAMLRSATTWPQLRGDSSRVDVPALFRADATAEKWMWNKRARAFLAARNLFDRIERAHPDGAHLGLRLHIGVDVELRRVTADASPHP